MSHPSEPNSVTLTRLVKNPPASMNPEEVDWLKGLLVSVLANGYNLDDVDTMYNLSTDGYSSWHKELGRLAARMEATHRAITAEPPKRKGMSWYKKVLLFIVLWTLLLNLIGHFS